MNKEEVNFKLVITKDSFESNSSTFDINNISDGDNYKFVDVYFQNQFGEVKRRNYNKGERKGNQTLPRLAFQLYEDKISLLTKEERLDFPTCQYTPDSVIIKGIFDSSDEYRKYRKTIEFLEYRNDNNHFVIYCWNIFSTLMFVQECLKRFGDEGDQFVLEYKAKNNEMRLEMKASLIKKTRYSNQLLSSHNLILRGAPGTGKTYLAKEIAKELTGGNGDQIGFVQFHPSYDYTDFVEGLRPVKNSDGGINFELQDGIFKKFCRAAIKNFVDSHKTAEILKHESVVQNKLNKFLSNVNLNEDEYQLFRGNKFFINNVTDEDIEILAPNNGVSDRLKLKISMLEDMLKSGEKFNQVRDISDYFKIHRVQQNSYYLALFKEIEKLNTEDIKSESTDVKLKNFVFIIDEINRGEISKIFGELFYSIDPGYRGPAGAVSTQYANMHESDEKFYIPENVYIIGTMNDIDRSVDTFDFAMRRRFRFIEITAAETMKMWDNQLDSEQIEEAKTRLTNLNKTIEETPELNANYHIGPSYFLKLPDLGYDYDILWRDYIGPLLEEYLRGTYQESEHLQELKKAYETKEEEAHVD